MTNAERARELLERAIPFLHDEGAKYDDDGSNEPLELARDIESFMASGSSDESAVVPAKTAFDGDSGASQPQGREAVAAGLREDAERYRWLRDSASDEWEVSQYVGDDTSICHLASQTLDTAIDAARKEAADA